MEVPFSFAISNSFSPLSSGSYPIFKPGVESLGSQTLHVEIRKVVLERTERAEEADVEILVSYIVKLIVIARVSGIQFHCMAHS